MVRAEALTQAFVGSGARLSTGVPCSILGALFGRDAEDRVLPHVAATSEGEAIGIAAGHWLAGGVPLVMCQNSGLGNIVNPITSLVHACRMAFPILCSWRGEPGREDAPQHEMMGRRTIDVLEAIELGWSVLPRDECEALEVVRWAALEIDHRSAPHCLLVRQGTLKGEAVTGVLAPSSAGGVRHDLGTARRTSRVDALEALLVASLPATAIVATTGHTGRELHALDDSPRHFYQLGAMGCAGAIGLGLAYTTERPILVIDGDGAALMKLGNMATIGGSRRPNLTHVVLDNGVHDSTGGQSTASPGIDLAAIALACGYASSVVCDGPADLADAVRAAQRTPGPHLVRVIIRPGTGAVPERPRMSAADMARRFRRFVTDGDAGSEGEQEQSHEVIA